MSTSLEPLTVREARRLALARAGLLGRRWTGLPERAAAPGKQSAGKRARKAALAVVRRFGYLQLDTVSIAGARSHGIVLHSRLEGLDPELPESLLRPGAPLFEYWGHEASWLPMELYPWFEFRRRRFAEHPWWGDLIGQHPEVANRVVRRIEDEGPLRSADFEGSTKAGWWDLKVTKKVVLTLWSRGDLAIRERRGFLRTFDLAERVIPDELRANPLPEDEAIRHLLLLAASGHGWATTGTLAATWRLRNRRPQIERALAELVESGALAPCELRLPGGKSRTGWIRPKDRELAARLRRIRPKRDEGVLLSPFDPVLWDRTRVQELFGFDQVLEIYKPADQRKYGYYCLPVLAGDRLVARVDLKAHRDSKGGGRLEVLCLHYEAAEEGKAVPAADREAVRAALARYGRGVGLEVGEPPP